MKKTLIVLVLLVMFALIGTASAIGPITFGNNGDLVVTYVSSSAWFNDEFGISSPGPVSLGKIYDFIPPVIFTDSRRCEKDVGVVLFITTPVSPTPSLPLPGKLLDPHGPQTYLSNQLGADGLDHASVTPNGDGSFRVAFEDSWMDSIDDDTNDVVLNVACKPTSIPTPEFPSVALPAALIVGLIGTILFIQKSKKD